MHVLWLSFILSSPVEAENIIKALRYQYELQLKDLRIENAKLQQEVHELKKKFATPPQCEESAESLPSGPKPAEVETKEVETKDDDLKRYKRALQLIDAESWNEAILLLEQLVKDFPQSQYADNAIFLMAEVYRVKGELELARIELLRLMEYYPRSERYAEAKLAIEKIESFQSRRDDR